MLAPSPALLSKVDQLLHQQIKVFQSPTLEEVQSLVYELELSQSELERQNKELRKRQQMLEAYRDRYIDLYDSAPLGYATLDEDGYLQEINLAGASMLGEDRDALIGYAFAECVAAEDRKAFQEHIRECASECREATSELRLVSKAGRTITVQLHSIPIVGPKDGTLCKTAITDITQRRDMEEAIRRSRAFLQTVIDAFPDIMLVIGRDYRILLANRAAREMAGGIDPAGCMTCHKLSHHRDLPCEGKNEPCPLHLVVASKAPTTVIHTHYDARNNARFVELSAAPMLDESGEVAGIIEVCRDITERKQAEETLAQERNLLRTLIDNLPDCIYVKDAQSRFMAANLATAMIMGAASPNDLLGKNDFDFYPRELAAEYFDDEQQLMRSGLPLLNKDEPHVDPVGNPRTIFTTKVPLKDGRGNVLGLVGISRDITERKQAQESLLRAQEQIANQQKHEREEVEAELAKVKDQLVRQTQLAALGQISASIAHDLRNPLTVVRIACRQLKHLLDRELPKGAQHLALIGRELDTVNRIINNLTEMAHAKQPRKELLDLEEVVLEAFDRLDHEESVHCIVQCDPQPFMVAADAVQLRQVFGNLLDNAIQAVRENASLRVHARRVCGVDVIELEDDGPGVPDELRERIFEPLFTTRPKGTGLGLPICRQIIEAHGGMIELTAKDDPGTVFRIRLPSPG
jgi:PAS domain S-box-containing protein